jgi:hypothetical protein
MYRIFQACSYGSFPTALCLSRSQDLLTAWLAISRNTLWMAAANLRLTFCRNNMRSSRIETRAKISKRTSLGKSSESWLTPVTSTVWPVLGPCPRLIPRSLTPSAPGCLWHHPSVVPCPWASMPGFGFQLGQCLCLPPPWPMTPWLGLAALSGSPLTPAWRLAHPGTGFLCCLSAIAHLCVKPQSLPSVLRSLPSARPLPYPCSLHLVAHPTPSYN